MKLLWKKGPRAGERVPETGAQSAAGAGAKTAVCAEKVLPGVLDLLGMLRRGWLVLAALVLAGALCGVLAAQALSGAATYSASANVKIGWASDAAKAAVGTKEEATSLYKQESAYFTNYLQSPLILQLAAEKLGGAALTNVTVTVTAGLSSPYTNVRVLAPAQQQAADVLDCVLGLALDEMKTRTDAITFARPAGDEPVTRTLLHVRSKKAFALYGMAAGLLAGVFVLLCADALRRTLHTAADAQEALGLPVSGDLAAAEPARAETVRMWRAAVRARLGSGGVLLLADAGKAACAQSAAQSLADALAAQGEAALVLTAQQLAQRAAAMEEAGGHAAAPEKAENAAAGQERSAAAAAGAVTAASALPAAAGTATAAGTLPAAADALTAEAAAHALAACGEQAAWVLICAPDAGRLSPAASLAASCGACMLVLARDATPADDAARAAAVLRAAGARELSVVLERAPARRKVRQG